jgi:hypothetical protein
VSVGAKDIVSKLLDSDPAKRLSAKDALKHFWVRAGMQGSGSNSFSIAEDSMVSPATRRRRRAIHGFRAAVFVVIAGFRMLYPVRVLALRREGMELPLLRSLPFLVGHHYEPASLAIATRGLCVGHMKTVLQLVAMLEASTTLTTFDVSMNRIDSLDVVQHIAKVAAAHPSRAAVHLDGSPLPALAGRALQRLARASTRLRVINVSGTSVGADAAAAIATSLREADRRRPERAASPASVSPSTSNLASPAPASPATQTAVAVPRPVRERAATVGAGRTSVTGAAKTAVRR